MHAIIEKVKNIAIKGANDTYSAHDRLIMAGEVDNMLKELVALGNTQIEGKYIFSGFMTGTKPFNEIYSGTDITGVVYSGDSGLMPEEVHKGELVNKNIPGSLFISASMDIFGVLISLRDNLRNNNTAGITADIGSAGQAMDLMLTIRTDLGARIKRTEDIDARITATKNTFTSLQSKIEDADMPEVITKFQLQQNVYQAAITSISKLLQQTTLADIIR
jgi:flagellar hook-associated protein 3 FlgL